MPKDTSLPPKSSKIVSYSSAETKILGEGLAPFLRAGDVISFSGDLGTGKTTFTQGLAKGLGVKERVTSPTFVILNLHQANKGLTLAHFDLYRLNSESDLEGIGATDYLGKKNIISVIEWPEKAKKLLPKSTMWVKFEHIDENKRRIIYEE